MSRPPKIHKPLKFAFTDIINAVADGKGVKLTGDKKPRQKKPVKAPLPPKQR
jgi:hypothetical protein